MSLPVQSSIPILKLCPVYIASRRISAVAGGLPAAWTPILGGLLSVFGLPGIPHRAKKLVGLPQMDVATGSKGVSVLITAR